MGLFSALFGSKKKGIQKSDRVYLTRKAANKAIVQYCIDEGMNNRHVIILYFFRETRQEFDAAVENATNVLWANAHHPAQVRQAVKDGMRNVSVIFAETHPDANTEANALNALEQMAPELKTVLFFNGLDDPIFIPFGAERIQKLMTAMGLKEDEPVEHAMITKSMDRAQKKVTEKKMNIGFVDSREEMFRRLKG